MKKKKTLKFSNLHYSAKGTIIIRPWEQQGYHSGLLNQLGTICHQGLSSLTCTAITDWDSGGCNAHCKGNSDPCLSSDSCAAHVSASPVPLPYCNAVTAPTLAGTVGIVFASEILLETRNLCTFRFGIFFM